MAIKTPIPSDKVAEFVERILVIENFRVTQPFILPLYANGSPTLLFQTAKGQLKGDANYLTLFGQTILPETLTLTDNFTLIAYFFKPFSLFPLFDVSAGELTDRPIDLTVLGSSAARMLKERLLNAQSTAEMLKLIDDYVYQLIATVKSDLRSIKLVTGTLAANPDKEVLRAVQSEIHVTERTFQRMFLKHVGVSPNCYRRICQFNAAFQQLQHRQFNKLTDIAFANRYADQSHYIRSFRTFTGIRPKDYLNLGNVR